METWVPEGSYGMIRSERNKYYWVKPLRFWSLSLQHLANTAVYLSQLIRQLNFNNNIIRALYFYSSLEREQPKFDLM